VACFLPHAEHGRLIMRRWIKQAPTWLRRLYCFLITGLAWWMWRATSPVPSGGVLRQMHPLSRGVKRLLQLINYFAIALALKSTSRSSRSLPLPWNKPRFVIWENRTHRVQYAVRFFKDEFEAHMQGSCPAGVCNALISIIDSKICTACGAMHQRVPGSGNKRRAKRCAKP